MTIGVSKEYGVEVIQFHERRLDSNIFCDFLRDCKQLPNLNFVLFGDNAPIHTSGVTKRFLNNNRLPVILNIPYEPELNPIENVFSQLKGYYRRLRLQ